MEEFIPLAAHELAARSYNHAQGNIPLLVAAGGINNGLQVASCLNAGADAVCIGSLLAASCESELDVIEKQKLIAEWNLGHDANLASLGDESQQSDRKDVKLSWPGNFRELETVDCIVQRLVKSAERHLQHTPSYEDPIFNLM